MGLLWVSVHVLFVPVQFAVGLEGFAADFTHKHAWRHLA